eukprot:TRINITY_DN1720_c0_g1_i7.p1 TRINITY_DN1720_c0_g1~~TRINITY_DN1720_c0_g1_i7.p1  ORF type:complete len:196 (+),score=31.71 TRINITY_DN1720_c0_g1_i7:84-590(+)
MTTPAPSPTPTGSTDSPVLALFLASMGMAASITFASLGSAYGMAKSGVAVMSIGIMHSDKVMKSLIPVIMAGMIGIYGLLIGILLVSSIKSTGYTHIQGINGFGGGLACGLSGLAAGIAIGIVGDAGIRAHAIQPKVFTPMIVILVFAEALGIFGLIIGIIAVSSSSK